jgi:hypothetical protein
MRCFQGFFKGAMINPQGILAWILVDIIWIISLGKIWYFRAIFIMGNFLIYDLFPLFLRYFTLAAKRSFLLL